MRLFQQCLAQFFPRLITQLLHPHLSRVLGSRNIWWPMQQSVFNPLPDEKILGLPKLKAFADDKLNVTQNIKVVFHRIENIVEKEENAGYQHFLLFPQCFQKVFFLQCVKSRHCVVMGLSMLLQVVSLFNPLKDDKILD